MNININGEVVSTSSDCLSDIIAQYGAKAPFAVAINGEFVAKPNYVKTQVNPDDLIDIVSPIFGG